MLQITLVTYSTTYTEATALANTLQSILGPSTNIVSINPYPKFTDSFRVDLKTIVPLDNPSAIIHQAIDIADQIVSPWLTYYDSDLEKIELIYNETENTQKRHPAFKAIKWAQITY